MNIEQAEKVLNLQLDWIKTADSKVAPLFAINIAMLGVLSSLITSYKTWDIWSVGLTTFSVVLLGLSIIFLALVVFPKTDGPKGSYIFFGGIAEKTQDDYITTFKELSQENLIHDLLSQTHRNAEIVQRKFKFIKHAFTCSFNALPFWLITILCIYQ